MKAWILAILGGALAACQPGSTEQDVVSAPAERTPMPASVPAFAQAVCADCHAMEPLALSPNPEAPSFVDIANREWLTEETLATWLTDAHNYPEAMDFDLEPGQVDELAAYMVTLKDPAYKRPDY